MVTALTMLVLAASVDGGVTGELQLTTSTEGCFTKLSATTPAVRWAWRSSCGLDWVQQHAFAAGALSLGNYAFSPVQVFDDARAVKLEPKQEPAFGRDAVGRVREALQRGLPPGVTEVTVDARDRSVLAMREGQFVRAKKDAKAPGGWSMEPVFTTPVGWVHREALAWDRNSSVKAPWAVISNLTKLDRVVQLVAPDGTMRELLQAPRTMAEVTTDHVSTVMLPGASVPIVSALFRDGQHTLLVPDATAPLGYRRHTFDQVPISLPSRPPDGSWPTPPSLPRTCSETVLEHVGESRVQPTLFEHHGHAFVAYGVRTTRARFHFGLVPRGGQTPAQDSFACEWVEDTRTVTPSLVVAEVQADGTSTERLRVELLEPVQQLVVDEGADHLAVMLKGQELTVLSLDLR